MHNIVSSCKCIFNNKQIACLFQAPEYPEEPQPDENDGIKGGSECDGSKVVGE